MRQKDPAILSAQDFFVYCRIAGFACNISRNSKDPIGVFIGSRAERARSQVIFGQYLGDRIQQERSPRPRGHRWSESWRCDATVPQKHATRGAVIGGVRMLLVLSRWLCPASGSRRHRIRGPMRPMDRIRPKLGHSEVRSTSAASYRHAGSRQNKSALRKNSEKWPIGGDLSSLPFHGFSAEASSASADALGTTAVGPYIFEGH